MVYLVSYDLNNPGKDYPSIIDAINRYDNPCHILKSQWLIESGKSAEQICMELVRFIDANDELFVCEVTQNRMGKFNQRTGFSSGLLGRSFKPYSPK